jgi:hypothetical protein
MGAQRHRIVRAVISEVFVPFTAGMVLDCRSLCSPPERALPFFTRNRRHLRQP